MARRRWACKEESPFSSYSSASRLIQPIHTQLVHYDSYTRPHKCGTTDTLHNTRVWIHDCKRYGNVLICGAHHAHDLVNTEVLYR